MGLEKVGLQGVFDLGSFNKKLSSYLDGIQKATKTTDDAAPSIGQGLATVGTAAAGAATVAAAAFTAISAGLIKLAADAAPLEQVGAAFRGLGGDIEALREGSLGMVTDADLMKQYNSAAQLVSKTFADQLPEAMGYLSKVAGSTGESMDYMMDSLVRGVGRMSGPILDNLKIQVAQAEITERAIQMYGKQEDALSKLELQEATMALTMEKLAAKTADIPDVTGSAAHSMATLQTTVKNLTDDMGVALLPVLEDLLPRIQTLATDYGPLVIEWATKFGDALIVVADAMGFVLDNLLHGNENVAEHNRQLALGAESYEEYRKAAFDALNIPHGVDEQMVKQEYLRQGLILSREAWEDLQLAEEMAALKAQEVALRTQETSAVVAEGSQVLMGVSGAWATYHRAVADAWDKALDPVELSKHFDDLTAVTLEHQDKMASITGEGADKEKVIQQQKYMEELKQQYNYILESMKAAMYKMSTENTEAGKAAKVALGIITATNTAKLADEYGYVADSLKLKEQLLTGEITTAQGMVEAYNAVTNARDGALAAAQKQLDKLMGQVAASAPKMKGAAEGATQPIDEVFDAVVDKVASGLSAMRELLHDIAGDELIEEGTLEENLDNLLSAMGIVVEKTLVKVRDLGLEYEELLAESTETSEQINKALSVLGNIGNIQQFGEDYEILKGGGTLEKRVDNYVWALGVIATRVIKQMQTLRARFGIDILKETAQTSEQIDKVLAALGRMTDLQQLGHDYEYFEGSQLGHRIDNYAWALRLVAGRIIKQMQSLQVAYGRETLEEVAETSGVINDTLAVVGSLGDLSQLGADYEYFEGAQLGYRIDNFIWGLGLVAARMISKMQSLRRVFGIDVLTEAAETAKVISDALSPLGAIPDLMALHDYDLLPDELLDDVLDNLDYLFDGMIGIANAAADKIDERTADVVDIMGTTFSALGSAIDVLLTLGGVEDEERYRSLFTGDRSDLWDAIKADLGTLLADIASWNLIVDVDAIKAVNAKLTEARSVVDNMLGIVSDITAMREQGGADVQAFRAILTQFSDVVNALGWGGAGVFAPPDATNVINPPDLSPVNTGAGRPGDTIITIRGEFVGPSGDFVTFSEEVALARETNINLGQIGSPNYAY